MQDPYGALVALIRFDKTIHGRERDIAMQKEAVAAISKNIQEAEKDSLKAREGFRQLEKRQNEIDLELRTCDQDERRITMRLDTAGRGKEFEALTHERTLLDSKRLKIETELESVWSQLAEAETALKRAQGRLDDIVREAAPLLNEHENEIKKGEDTLLELRRHRGEFLAAVRPEWVALYEQMHARVVNPFVPVVNGACGGCGSAISRVDIASVEHHQLVSCQTCRRMLYDSQVPEEIDAAQVVG